MKERSKFKRGQEEMVGFGLIIIIVALILLFLLWFSNSRSSKSSVESYEVESFVKAFLQYTTECENRRDGFLEVQDLIFECVDNEVCLDGRNSCEVLNATLGNIVDNSFKVSMDSPVKGYWLEINRENQGLVKIEEGNKTGNSKGAGEDFSKRGESIEILFSAYY